MVALTGRQANVMDHALAYPKMTRNHFYAMLDTQNHDTWKELVDLKYASLLRQEGGYKIYFVTEAGKEALKEYHNEPQ